MQLRRGLSAPSSPESSSLGKPPKPVRLQSRSSRGFILKIILFAVCVYFSGRIQLYFSDAVVIETTSAHPAAAPADVPVQGTRADLSNREISQPKPDCAPVTFPSRKKTLNLIFQNSFYPAKEGGDMLEFDWIFTFLLAGIGRPINVINQNETLRMDNSLVVINKRARNADYFDTLKEDGIKNIGLLHLNDEGIKASVNFYSKLDYVFRNYFYLDYVDGKRFKNVHYMPLGTRPGYGDPNPETLLPSHERKHLCNFLGSLTRFRKEMRDVVEENKIPCVTFLAKAWMGSSNLGAIQYREIILNSKFTLCPDGNNPESMRFYEALQVGSIPIVLNTSIWDYRRDWITHGLGAPPVPILQNWRELPALLDRIAADPDRLVQMQNAAIMWWQRYRKAVQLRVKRVIDRAFGDSDDLPPCPVDPLDDTVAFPHTALLD